MNPGKNRRPRNLQRREAILDMLRSGTKSDAVIARIHGVSPSWVSRIRKGAGVTTRLPLTHYYKLSPEKREILFGLLNRANFSDSRIARKMGVTPQNVAQWRKKNVKGTPWRKHISRFREARIKKLISKGLSTRQIAKMTNVSNVTVNNIKRRMNSAKQ